eukprot:CAMPEP_0114488518 /NCGR_PEP_ID=MMETSP0109-20121206/1375_1 /TAXON_ID=29199 /ORGANISM="Chlorarachnion reptans, Strain CCCM449" /LENGTH=90 /DNA_ID=CAMNT_0001664921 /DNA_START=1 /DNA_END=273 /DNA_ORIENTATION=+
MYSTDHTSCSFGGEEGGHEGLRVHAPVARPPCDRRPAVAMEVRVAPLEMADTYGLASDETRRRAYVESPSMRTSSSTHGSHILYLPLLLP